MRNYDLEIAECKGNPQNLNKMKRHLYFKYLLFNYLPGFSKTNVFKILYFASSVDKELGYKKKYVNILKKLHSKNSESNFFLASLLSSIKKYGDCDNFYFDLIQTFKSRIKDNQYYYRGKSSQDTIHKIKENGFVIIKDFFKTDIIEIFQKNFDKNLLSSKKILKERNIDYDNWVFPLYMIINFEDKNELLLKINEGFKDNWFLKKYFNNHDISYVNKNLISEIKKSFLNDVISKYTHNDNWSLYHDYSMARKISSGAKKKAGYSALHQDSRIQLLDKHYLTFWIPFCKVGNQYAPTLGVIPTFCEHFYPYEYSSDNKGDLKRFLSFDDFPQECILTPEMNVGDIWIHDSYTLHGTSYGNNYSGSRCSIDLRFF